MGETKERDKWERQLGVATGSDSGIAVGIVARVGSGSVSMYKKPRTHLGSIYRYRPSAAHRHENSNCTSLISSRRIFFRSARTSTFLPMAKKHEVDATSRSRSIEKTGASAGCQDFKYPTQCTRNERIYQAQ